MTEDVIDYGEHAGEGSTTPAFGENTLAVLMQKADLLQMTERHIERLEELAKLKKAKLKNLMEVEVRAVVGKHFKGVVNLPDGRKLDVGEKVRSNLSKATKGPAIDWMNNNGHDRLVSRTITIAFAKEDTKWANKFEGDMKKRKRKIPYKREETVNHQTLEAFVRERLKEGDDIPQDTFGVYFQTIVKVK